VIFGFSIGKQVQNITSQKTIFLRPGEQPPRKGINTNSRPGQLEAARDWKMLADLDQRLIFPL